MSTPRRVPMPFVVLGVLLTTILAGCTSSTPPTPMASSSAGGGSAAPVPAPSTAPTLDPRGGAAANLAYFDLVNQRLLATNGSPKGRDVIDNLVAAGFAKADMELTPDTTSAGVGADNVQFSVRISDSCLIGQVGSTGYGSQATTLLGTGHCLVGKTRTIDW